MYKEKLDAYLDAHVDEMIEDIFRLVRINSERTAPEEGMPYGKGPKEALDEALKMAEEKGFATKNYDNYVGAVDFGDLESQLDILAHLDVVPAGDGWTVTEPYNPVRVEDKIYGRGVADDKGPAIAALYAMMAVKACQVPLKKNVRLIVGTDEECGSSDIVHYYAVEKEAPMTFSPDAEFPVINLEKGGLSPVFEASWEESKELPRILSIKGGTKVNVVPGKAYAVVEGVSEDVLKETAAAVTADTKVEFTWDTEGEKKSIMAVGAGAHAASPFDGNNALTALLLLLSKLPLAPCKGVDAVKSLVELFPHGDCYGKALGVAMEDEVSGVLTLNFSMMDYCPTGFSGQFDSRTPVCANEENMRDVAEAAFARHGIQMEHKSMKKPHHVPADSPFVQTLLKAYEEYTGLKGECLAIGGGTYVHNLERGVAFGCSLPGTDNRMHGADEVAMVNELLLSAKIFAKVIVDLCM